MKLDLVLEKDDTLGWSGLNSALYMEELGAIKEIYEENFEIDEHRLDGDKSSMADRMKDIVCSH